jgi:hypothetical protein
MGKEAVGYTLTHRPMAMTYGSRTKFVERERKETSHFRRVFIYFLKLGSSSSNSTARLGEREGGFAVLPPHVALPLLNQLPTVLILKKKKKNRATGCRPL